MVSSVAIIGEFRGEEDVDTLECRKEKSLVLALVKQDKSQTGPNCRRACCRPTPEMRRDGTFPVFARLLASKRCDSPNSAHCQVTSAASRTTTAILQPTNTIDNTQI